MTAKVKPLTRRQTERHRSSIQTSALLTRLKKHAMGTLMSPKGEPVDMSSTQIRAAEILLSKALPNLTATEVTNVEDTQDRTSLDEQLKTLLANLSKEEREILQGITSVPIEHHTVQ